MKVIKTENSIGLIPETQFEIDCCKEINRRDITKTEFEDSWNQIGTFFLHFRDEDDWGR